MDSPRKQGEKTVNFYQEVKKRICISNSFLRDLYNQASRRYQDLFNKQTRVKSLIYKATSRLESRNLEWLYSISWEMWSSGTGPLDFGNVLETSSNRLVLSLFHPLQLMTYTCEYWEKYILPKVFKYWKYSMFSNRMRESLILNISYNLRLHSNRINSW